MIPTSQNAREVIQNYKGNYGLWFNKLVDLGNDLKAPDNVYKILLDKYDLIKEFAGNYLKEKHIYQYYLCESFSQNYEILTVKAELKTPLITGIGQTHPGEVGMVFDHNIGVPYIPSSTIKGIIRFSHTLGLMEDLDTSEVQIDNEGMEYFNDEEEWTNIPKLFGKGGDKGNVGRIIFLDAYPEKIPNLHLDIMNPHYGEYYSEGSNPGDYLDPVPIKFLTVNKENYFIFRILVEKKHNKLDKSKTLFSLAKEALEKALMEEGIGAKTAVGYGRFENFNYAEPDWIIKKYEEKFMTEEDKLIRVKHKLIDRIKNAQKESDEINSLFDEWQNNKKLKSNKEIAEVFKDKVKKKKADKSFTKQYQIVADILEIDLNKPAQEKQKIEEKQDDIFEKDIEKFKKEYLKANEKEKKKIHKKYAKKYSKQKINKIIKELGIK